MYRGRRQERPGNEAMCLLLFPTTESPNLQGGSCHLTYSLPFSSSVSPSIDVPSTCRIQHQARLLSTLACTYRSRHRPRLPSTISCYGCDLLLPSTTGHDRVVMASSAFQIQLSVGPYAILDSEGDAPKEDDQALS